MNTRPVTLKFSLLLQHITQLALKENQFISYRQSNSDVQNAYVICFVELCGTPGYLAPEALKVSMYDDAVGYGRPVDMWASGVIMYTMYGVCLWCVVTFCIPWSFISCIFCLVIDCLFVIYYRHHRDKQMWLECRRVKNLREHLTSRGNITLRRITWQYNAKKTVGCYNPANM